MSGINQKEYLKKYLGIGKGSGDKKKKKKKVKPVGNKTETQTEDQLFQTKNQTFSFLRIIDDDIDVQLTEEIQDDLAANNEDAPQVVAVIDERPSSLKMWKAIGESSDNPPVPTHQPQKMGFSLKLEKDTSNRKREHNNSLPLKKIKSEKIESDGDVSPSRRNARDMSPPRKNRNSDISPPRKIKHSDISPSRNTERDMSPPRKSRNTDMSPPRKNRSNDLSPPRKSDRDMSPPRKNRHTDLSPLRNNKDMDISPPRKNSRTDLSPPRKKKDKDISPPRRNRDSDLSPRRNRDSDISLPRRSRHGDLSPPRRSRKSPSPQRKDSSSDRKKKKGSRWGDFKEEAEKMKKTLDGKAAGLQNAQKLVEETTMLKMKEDELFKQMSSEVSGRGANTVFRKKKKDVDPEEEEMKRKKEEEMKEKYHQWGKGLKQVDDRNKRMEDELHEMSKPLARYADDEDLEKYLKEQEREGDPMLAYLRKKKKKEVIESGIPDKQTYQGEFMPNRFGIRPGYRWDGRDRSNGYEAKYFDIQNKKKASLEESYKWSTEDM